jgi:hypothetical protein
MGAGAAKLSEARPVIDVASCWFGYDHLPLFPNHQYTDYELIKKNPYFHVKLDKKNEYKGYDDSNRITIILTSQYQDTAEIIVYPQGDPDPIELFSITEEEDEQLKESLSRREFRFGADDKPIYNYLVYVVQHKPVEGKFDVTIANKSLNYEMEVNLTKAFHNNKWFEETDLPLKTSIDGGWSGFSTYSGVPTDMNEDDWLLYSPIYIFSVKQVRVSCHLILKF